MFPLISHIWRPSRSHATAIWRCTYVCYGGAKFTTCSKLLTMRHPFQCVATVNRSIKGKNIELLLTACGSRLVCTSLSNGNIVSEWTAGESGKVSAIATDEDSNVRPTKKQKADPRSLSSPKIYKLSISPLSTHAVAVSDDKCIRVFEIQDNGQLIEVSERFMPKRPCAIRILPDNATLLCGDKFGDVYSLPLLPAASAEDGANGDSEVHVPQSAAEPFKPSASNLTVHTQRNRRALEAQMKQASLSMKAKEPLKFEHSLLLGHVSMLTDVTYATRKTNGREHGYIITADRDEHVRVSRGPPQAYVIEGYCLGHSQFVSKICAVNGADLLITGGGDDWICVWDWSRFRLLHRLDSFARLIRGTSDGDTKSNLQEAPIAVSGIWIVPLLVEGQVEEAIAIACEKSSRLAVIAISELRKSGSSEPHISIVDFERPLVDLATAGEAIVASLDARNNSDNRLELFKLVADKNAPSNISVERLSGEANGLATINDLAEEIEDDKAVDGLLYSVGNLRKWHGKDGTEEVDEGNDG